MIFQRVEAGDVDCARFLPRELSRGRRMFLLLVGERNRPGCTVGRPAGRKYGWNVLDATPAPPYCSLAAAPLQHPCRAHVFCSPFPKRHPHPRAVRRILSPDTSGSKRSLVQGCQTARQNCWEVPGESMLVMLKTPPASMFVETVVQLIRSGDV
jgi:hypothetical protein